jgi:hypothetical protein
MYFDRKEKRKKTSSIWALSLEVEGDDMRKLIANLTEYARLFAETRKLLGSGGKVFEVVEDEQEQALEVAAEFYPPLLNGSSAIEPTEAASPTDKTSGSAPSNSQVRLRPLEAVPRFLSATGLPNQAPVPPPLFACAQQWQRKFGIQPASQRVPDSGTSCCHNQEASYR